MRTRKRVTFHYYPGVILVITLMMLLRGCNIWEFHHMGMKDKASITVPGISLKTRGQNETPDEVNIGDKVTVKYTTYLKQEAELQQIKLEKTTEFTVGHRDVFSRIEKAILGMEQNGTKRITVPSDDAYGPRYEELIQTLPRSFLPATMTPEPGETIDLRDQNGNIVSCKIVEVKAESVRIDLNHPLAGKDLVFEVQVLQIASG